MVTKSKRIEYIDYTKAFAIFMVIVGHSIQNLSTCNELDIIYSFIYSFHMPLFMVLSGFFITKTFHSGIIQFLTTRSIHLLLPVLSFSIIVFLIHWLTPLDMTTGLNFFEYIFGGDMWFLKYLFACSFIAFIANKIFKKTYLAAIIPTVLLISLSRVGIFRLLPFLWLGYYIHKYEYFVSKHIKCLLFISITAFAFLLMFWKMEYDAPLYRIITFKHSITISFYAFCVIIYRFLIGAFGSLFFIFLFKMICDKNIQIKFPTLSRYIMNAGKRTLGIYCLQIYLLEDAANYLNLPQTNNYVNILIVIAVTVFEFIVCNMLVGLLEKQRFLRLLFLGQKK